MFGYSEAEMIGRKLSILALEGTPGRSGGYHRRVFAPANQRCAMKRSGAVRTAALIEIAAVASPILDSTGKVSGISRVCRDVTERRRAEEAIQRSDKQKTDILESIRDGFVALDKNWVFTYVNA